MALTALDARIVVQGPDGERVVARAGSFLRDGDRVRPVALAVPEPAVAAAPSPRETAEAGTP